MSDAHQQRQWQRPSCRLQSCSPLITYVKRTQTHHCSSRSGAGLGFGEIPWVRGGVFFSMLGGDKSRDTEARQSCCAEACRLPRDEVCFGSGEGTSRCEGLSSCLKCVWCRPVSASKSHFMGHRTDLNNSHMRGSQKSHPCLIPSLGMKWLLMMYLGCGRFD